jgi:tRNA-Thr(GGU) m(6)t(6)A37 methyltransferase TsaA
MSEFGKRVGEIALFDDPADFADDGKIVFIGKIHTSWKTRTECPKNLVQARERGIKATIEIDEFWRAGLRGLEDCSHLIVLYWMHEARRDLIVQNPRHRSEPVGVFALRSPARPNPIALSIVRILDVDLEAGKIEIDAIDCLDGTPVVDIKPWFSSIDTVQI